MWMSKTRRPSITYSSNLLKRVQKMTFHTSANAGSVPSASKLPTTSPILPKSASHSHGCAIHASVSANAPGVQGKISWPKLKACWFQWGDVCPNPYLSLNLISTSWGTSILRCSSPWFQTAVSKKSSRIFNYPNPRILSWIWRQQGTK